MGPNRRATDVPDARNRRRKTLLWGALGAIGFALLVAMIVFQQHTIQQSREYTILRSCQESNDRHDQTFARLDRLLLVRVTRESVDASIEPKVVERRLIRAVAALPPAERVRVEQSRASTRLLIDALSPKRDCRKRADSLTRTS